MRIFWFSGCSLWLGRDHLLKVRNTGFTESYRRYYLKDVQAISVTETRTWMQWALGLFVLDLIFLFICILVDAEAGVITAFFTILPVTICLAINFFRGPSCVCRIHTAVQADRIEALSRLRGAKRVIESLRPVITEAQGGFTAEDVAAMNTAVTDGAARPPQAGPADETFPDAGAADAAPLEFSTMAAAEPPLDVAPPSPARQEF